METNIIILINWINLHSISEVANIVVALGIIIAVFTYHSTRKGNYLQSIENCSKEYRDYMRLIQTNTHNDTLKRDILGLFHKQLFYIKNNYVPKDIKIEWLSTMYAVLTDEKHNKLQFCKDDYTTSFSRVRCFVEKSEDKNSVRKSTKEIKKAYKKCYFSIAQRICLNSNEEWKDAFVINDKQE